MEGRDTLSCRAMLAEMGAAQRQGRSAHSVGRTRDSIIMLRQPTNVREWGDLSAIVTASKGGVSLDCGWAQNSGFQCVIEAWIAVGGSSGVECGCVSQPVDLTVIGEGERVPHASCTPSIGRTSRRQGWI